jgi:hypothetical protein
MAQKGAFPAPCKAVSVVVHAAAVRRVALDQIPGHMPRQVSLHPAPVDGARPAAAAVGIGVGRVALAAPDWLACAGKRLFLLNFSLCLLSRACLDKLIVSICRWLSKTVVVRIAPVAIAAAGTDSAFRSGSCIPSAPTALKKSLSGSFMLGRKLKSRGSSLF